MSATSPFIFRAEAARRYTERECERVVPLFVTPPVRLCLGVLAALLACGAAVIGLTPIPEQVSGCAIFLGQDNTSEGMKVAVLLPSAALSRVRPGQTLLLRPAAVAGVTRTSLLSVEWGAVDRVALPQRVARAESASFPQLSAATMIVAAAGDSEDATVGAGCGTGYEARVIVGSRRALAIVPLIDRWLLRS